MIGGRQENRAVIWRSAGARTILAAERRRERIMKIVSIMGFAAALAVQAGVVEAAAPTSGGVSVATAHRAAKVHRPVRHGHHGLHRGGNTVVDYRQGGDPIIFKDPPRRRHK
ncbi:MAG: hypothetical protein ACHP7N_18265 [Caulobacterales bacterium]